MRICGLGAPEMIIIALMSYVVLGPERTRSTALDAGRLLRRVMRSVWWRDFSRLARDLRDLPNTLVRLAELEEMQAELQKNVSEIQKEVTFDLPSTGDAIATDPWGIENAVAETTSHSGKTAPPTEEEAPKATDSPTESSDDSAGSMAAD